MMNQAQTETLTFSHKGASEKLVFDNRAWDMAKAAAQPGEALSVTIDRANKYKAALASEAK